MAGIDVRVQKRHGNGFNALAFEAEYGLTDLFFIERSFHLALNGHAFADFNPAATRDQGRCALPKNVVYAGPPKASNFQFISKAFGCNQPGLRPLFFQDRVGGYGCAVDETRNDAI